MPRLVFFSKLSKKEKYPANFEASEVEFIEDRNWSHVRAELEIRAGMHPHAKFDQERRMHVATLEFSTWKRVGFVVGFLLNRKPDAGTYKYLSGGNKWWFLDFPMLKSNAVLRESDTVLVFNVYMYEPPLTRTESLPVPFSLMCSTFHDKLWLPKDSCSMCGDIAASAKTSFPKMYDTKEHYTDSFFMYIEPDFFWFSFGLFRDMETEERIKASSSGTRVYFLEHFTYSK